MSTQPHISARFTKHVERARKSKGAALSPLWKPTRHHWSANNPEGVINLGLAENSLMHEYLAEFYNTNLQLQPLDLTYGTSLNGSDRLLDALISFYSKYIKPLRPIQREEIVTGNGTTHLLDQLARAICEPGEAIMIPAPFYTAFPGDFYLRSDVATVKVTIEEKDIGGLGEVRTLERELERRAAAGEPKVRAVVLTNPANPLGFAYSRSTLEAYAKLVEKHDIYLIADEVYAVTVFESDFEDPNPFISMLSLDPEEVGFSRSRIIQLYAISKDFGSNGLRAANLVVQDNPLLVEAMLVSGLCLKLSSPADALWSALLNSPKLSTYIFENQRKLSEAYKLTTSFLKGHNIPYRKSHAALFVLIDLRAFLDREADNPELEVVARFVKEGVYVSNGAAYSVKELGHFRLTFSADRPRLLEGLRRIEKALSLPPSIHLQA
ncbi:PLP-dependent transferase [Meredithblackwellia eburnea MCA 4105]